MRKPISSILLAEDDNLHYTNFVQAVNTISASIDIMRVENGYSLFNMLETNIHPDVIFLDINMPYKGGLQILEELKERVNIKNVPIVILSSSAYDLVIKISYQLGAIFFIKKYNRPQDLSKCLEFVFNNPSFVTCTQPAWKDFLIE